MSGTVDRVRILFVDDEPQLLRELGQALQPQRDSWHMGFAGSATEALDLLDRAVCDVVVSDHRMPGRSGEQLLSLVRIRQPQCVRILLCDPGDRRVMTSVGVAHQFLSKPARAETIRDTVRRLCQMRSHLGNPSLRSLLASLESLPSLPGTQRKLAEELESPSASMSAVGELVAQDVGMCAKVLQLVNSSLFGLSKQVTRPQEAVSYLGLEFVKNLVLSEHLMTQCSPRGASLTVINRIRSQSLRVSALAGRIARDLGQSRAAFDHAVAAGMLHQVGLLAMHGLLPPAYSQVERLALTGPWPEAEKKVLGTTHAQVGAYLLGLWGLPSDVVDAIAWYLEPSKGPSLEVFTPLAALHIASGIERPETELDMAYVDALGLRGRLSGWRSAVRAAT